MKTLAFMVCAILTLILGSSGETGAKPPNTSRLRYPQILNAYSLDMARLESPDEMQKIFGRLDGWLLVITSEWKMISRGKGVEAPRVFFWNLNAPNTLHAAVTSHALGKRKDVPLLSGRIVFEEDVQNKPGAAANRYQGIFAFQHPNSGEKYLPDAQIRTLVPLPNFPPMLKITIPVMAIDDPRNTDGVPRKWRAYSEEIDANPLDHIPSELQEALRHHKDIRGAKPYLARHQGWRSSPPNGPPFLDNSNCRGLIGFMSAPKQRSWFLPKNGGQGF